jgi:hypothetical protein
MIKVSRVTVLAEDRNHQSFAKRYLRRVGYKEHQIFLEQIPNGAGSGEQWVRENYARTVHDCRHRAANAGTALVVVIDADDQEPARRQRQLEAELAEARSGGERIAHLIPKRNIETWILCLDGKVVDEIKDYSRDREIAERIRPAAETFYAWTRPHADIPSHCVPSLRAAIPEAHRLDQ